jgi:hypothetical protein
MEKMRYSSIILNLGSDGGEWSALRPCRFIPKERALRCPLDLRLGGAQQPVLEAMKKKKTILLHLAGVKPRFLSRPARSLFALTAFIV